MTTEAVTPEATEQVNPESAANGAGDITTQENTTLLSNTGDKVETPENVSPENKEEAKTEKKEETEKPEKIEYTDFDVPEGIQFDNDVLNEFKTIGQELGINQESAQKILNLQTKLVQKQQEQLESTMKQQAETWKNEVFAKDEFKGDEGLKNIQKAASALQNIGGDHFKSFLEATGLENHPVMVDIGFKLHKLMAEDELVHSNKSGGEKPATLEQALYGN